MLMLRAARWRKLIKFGNLTYYFRWLWFILVIYSPWSPPLRGGSEQFFAIALMRHLLDIALLIVSGIKDWWGFFCLVEFKL